MGWSFKPECFLTNLTGTQPARNASEQLQQRIIEVQWGLCWSTILQMRKASKI